VKGVRILRKVGHELVILSGANFGTICSKKEQEMRENICEKFGKFSGLLGRYCCRPEDR
jgi:hypothetical protein